MTSSSDTEIDTRHRLLEAAGEVFAQRGFRKATIREICRRAKSNVAAVNYHFGDKQRLYHAVIEYIHQDHLEGTGSPDDELAVAEGLPPEQQLRSFVSGMMKRHAGAGHESWRPGLMAHEIAEPTGALDMVVERFIRPRFNRLVGIVGALAGGDVPLERLQLAAESVVAQCIHFMMARSLLMRLMPQLSYGPEDLEALVDHITQFSVSAIEDLRSESEIEPTRAEERS